MSDDGELEAIQVINKALDGLDSEAKSRVISYVVSRHAIRLTDQAVTGKQARIGTKPTPEDPQDFAEIYASASPQTEGQKALIAGYWLQVIQGADEFEAQSANALLKDLGHGVKNITAALDDLIEQKPQLVLQLKKSGSTRQARKKYRVTGAGAKAVEQMTEKAGENSPA